MPTYEYNCTKCHKHFELFQKITDEAKTKCPNCGGRAERLISRSSFSLKGGGWYKDGYGSAKKDKKKDDNVSEDLALPVRAKGVWGETANLRAGRSPHDKDKVENKACETCKDKPCKKD